MDLNSSDAVRSTWSWIPDWETYVRVHHCNEELYSQFVRAATRLEVKLTNVTQLMCPMPNTVQRELGSTSMFGDLASSTQTVIDEMLSCHEDFNRLCADINKVHPRRAHQSSVADHCAIRALCNFKHKEVTIDKDRIYLMCDGSDPVWWKVYNDNGSVIEVPSLIFVVPPPDKQSLERIERIRICLLETWRSMSQFYKSKLRTIILKTISSSKAESLTDDESIQMRDMIHEGGVLDLLSPRSEDTADKLDFREWMQNWVTLTDQLQLNIAPEVDASSGLTDRMKALKQSLYNIKFIDNSLISLSRDHVASELTKHEANARKSQTCSVDVSCTESFSAQVSSYYNHSTLTKTDDITRPSLSNVESRSERSGCLEVDIPAAQSDTYSNQLQQFLEKQQSSFTCCVSGKPATKVLPPLVNVSDNLTPHVALNTFPDDADNAVANCLKPEMDKFENYSNALEKIGQAKCSPRSDDAAVTKADNSSHGQSAIYQRSTTAQDASVKLPLAVIPENFEHVADGNDKASNSRDHAMTVSAILAIGTDDLLDQRADDVSLSAYFEQSALADGSCTAGMCEKLWPDSPDLLMHELNNTFSANDPILDDDVLVTSHKSLETLFSSESEASPRQPDEHIVKINSLKAEKPDVQPAADTFKSIASHHIPKLDLSFVDNTCLMSGSDYINRLSAKSIKLVERLSSSSNSQKQLDFPMSKTPTSDWTLPLQRGGTEQQQQRQQLSKTDSQDKFSVGLSYVEVENFLEVKKKLIEALSVLEQQLSVFGPSSSSAENTIAETDLLTFTDIEAQFAVSEQLVVALSDVASQLPVGGGVSCSSPLLTENGDVQFILSNIVERFAASRDLLATKKRWITENLERQKTLRNTSEKLAQWLTEARRQLGQSCAAVATDRIGAEFQLETLTALANDFDQRASLLNSPTDLVGNQAFSIDPDPNLLKQFWATHRACKSRLEKQQKLTDVIDELSRLSEKVRVWANNAIRKFSLDKSNLNRIMSSDIRHCCEELKTKSDQIEQMRSKVVNVIAFLKPGEEGDRCTVSAKTEKAILEPLTELGVKLKSLSEILSGRVEHLASEHLKEMETSLDALASRLADIGKNVSDPDAGVTIQLVESLQNGHSEIQQRSSSCIDALNSLLKDVQNVPMIDCRSTCRRVAQLLAKAAAMNKKSVARLADLNELGKLVSMFNTSLEDLKSCLEKLRSRANAIEIPFQGSVESIVLEMREAQRALEALSQKKAALNDLMDIGRLMSTKLSDETVCTAAVISVAKNIENSYGNLSDLIRNKLKKLKHEAHAAEFDMNNLTDSIHQLLCDTKCRLENAEPLAFTVDLLLAQEADINSYQDDLQHCQALVDLLGDMIRKAIETGRFVETEELCTDQKSRLTNLNHMQIFLTNCVHERAVHIGEAKRMLLKYNKSLAGSTDLLRAIERHLDQFDDPAFDLCSSLLENESNLLHLKSDFEKSQLLAGEASTVLVQIKHLYSASNIIPIDKQMRDLHTDMGEIGKKLAKCERQTRATKSTMNEIKTVFQAAAKSLNEIEEKLQEFTKFCAHPNKGSAPLTGIQHFQAELLSNLGDINKLRYYCDLLPKSSSVDDIAADVEDLASRWTKVNSAVTGVKEKPLLQSILDLGEPNKLCDVIDKQLQSTEVELSRCDKVYGDPQIISSCIKVLQVHRKYINQYGSVLERLRNHKPVSGTGSSKKPDCGSQLQEKIGSTSRTYDAVCRLFASKETILKNRLNEIEALLVSVKELTKTLLSCENQLTPLITPGAKVEIIQGDVEKLQKCDTELKNLVEPVEKILTRSAEVQSNSKAGCCLQLKEAIELLIEYGNGLQSKIEKSKESYSEQIAQATKFHSLLPEHLKWIRKAEAKIVTFRQTSKLLDTAAAKQAEYKDFENEVNKHRKVVDQMFHSGLYLKSYSRTPDTFRISKEVNNAQIRWRLLLQVVSDQTEVLDTALQDAKRFYMGWKSTMLWADNVHYLNSAPQHLSMDSIRKILVETKGARNELMKKTSAYYMSLHYGMLLKDRCVIADPERAVIGEMLRGLKTRWKSTWQQIAKRENFVHNSLLSLGRYGDALQSIYESIVPIEMYVDDQYPVNGDMQTVGSLVGETRAIYELLEERRSLLESIQDRAGVDGPYFDRVISVLDNTLELCRSREERLHRALMLAEQYKQVWKSLHQWLHEAESDLDKLSHVTEDKAELQRMLDQLGAVDESITEHEEQIQRIGALSVEILSWCHPYAVPTVEKRLSVVETSWHKLLKQMRYCQHSVQSAIRMVEDNTKSIEELIVWTKEMSLWLSSKTKNSLPTTMEAMESLLSEHADFSSELTAKQNIVERLTGFDRDLSDDNSVASELNETSLRSPVRSRANVLHANFELLVSITNEYKRCLQDHCTSLGQSYRTNVFSLNMWKDRFNNFARSKLLRVTDLFRKKLKDQGGRMSREEFVERMLATKFPTTVNELHYVFDAIDTQQQGLIHYKQFSDILCHQRIVQRKTTTAGGNDEAAENLIHQAITKELSLCRCAQPFTASAAGDDFYRFGEKPQKYRVKMVNGNAMVRIGPSYEPLSTFLEKVDVCRAKLRNSPEIANSTNNAISRHMIMTGGTITDGGAAALGYNSRKASHSFLGFGPNKQ